MGPAPAVVQACKLTVTVSEGGRGWELGGLGGTFAREGPGNASSPRGLQEAGGFTSQYLHMIQDGTVAGLLGPAYEPCPSLQVQR